MRPLPAGKSPDGGAAQPQRAAVPGYVCIGHGQVEKPKRFWNRCRHPPRDPQLHFQLGIAYDRLNQFDRAVKEFEQVLQLDPKNTAAMNYRDILRGSRHQLPEAEKLVRQAVKRIR